MYSEALLIDELVKRIIAGEYLSNEKFPSENQLAEEFQLPRMTVRKALQHLEGRGHLYSVRGKGRYLKPESDVIHLHLSGGESFTDKMLASGYDLKTVNLFSPANEINKENQTYMLSRLRYINGEPIAIHQSYVNTEVFPTIKKDAPTITSMFAYYRAHGFHHFTNNGAVLSVQFPSAYEQELLKCNNILPLICLESHTVCEDTEKILERTCILYRSDKFKYRLR
ncbi:GntR family transcriptional regulator [Cytobacillus kochii]|uniref:GntR family transcriptional regulator n=1 Tax=Cytobacillus kochii TaxID=859143 RepID=UPI00203EB898|nr:GntR family transcriptional regulator [Cytobacillus kochii]MCM3322342.1 GntR family transcriptional regulator [Cytobacillus kochii]MCM3345179.1 GntR family transcriptional regulator [Cytobacillus kochii]